MLRTGMMTSEILSYKNLKESIKIIKDIGFECGDLTLFDVSSVSKLCTYFSGDDYKEVALDIKNYAESVGLPLVQSHAPFPIYCEGNDEYNSRMFCWLIRCIEICGIIGINNLVIHPWNNFTDEQNISFFKKLLPYAVKNNVVICTENMWNWDSTIERAKPCACSLPESFINTVRGVNSPYFKACVDIGHAEMFSHLSVHANNLIGSLGKDVYCLHIHDNDCIHDSHMRVFDGIIDFNKAAEALYSVEYKYDLIAETVINLKEYDTYEKALEYWKHSYKTLCEFKKMIEKKYLNE